MHPLRRRPEFTFTEAGIHKVTMLLQQPIHSVAFAARFLVCREGDDYVALRSEMLALHPQQRCEDGRVLSLHVYGAAPVQPAVVLGQVELDHEVQSSTKLCLYHVQMAQIQNRLALSATVEAGDNIAGARVVLRYE